MKLGNMWRALPLLMTCGAASAQFTAMSAYLAPGGESTPGRQGATSAVYAVGGAVEHLLSGDGGSGIESSWFGAGAGLSAIVPGKGKAANSLGTLDINGYVHGRNFFRDRKFDPFLTAGYTAFFGDFQANGWNGGLGFHYWFRENRGFLLETTDQTALGHGKPGYFWQIRIGLVFR